MIDALSFLIIRSARNRWKTHFKRLRRPRYAVGAVAGLLYFGWIFGGGGAQRSYALMGITRDGVRVGLVALLFVFVASMWLRPGRREPSLGFTLADVHHLFPAPLTRHQLLAYCLARAQFGAVIVSVFFTVLARPEGLAAIVSTFMGCTLVLSTLGVHGMAESMSRPAHAGWVGIARKWIPLTVVILTVGVVTPLIASAWPQLAALPDTPARLQELARLLSTGTAGLLLYPFHLVAGVPMATSWPALAAALVPAVALWAIHVLWVIRSDAAFEEAAASQAERIARLLQRQSPLTLAPARRRTVPFTLRPVGRVEIAILWKNLTGLSRMPIAMIIVLLIGAAGVGIPIAMTIGRAGGMAAQVAVLFACLAGMVTIAGPLQCRFDLRQDLDHLATLKTWPVSGAMLLRGEVLAPIVVLAGVSAISLVLAAMLGGAAIVQSLGTSIATVVSWTASMILLSAGVISAQVVIQNGITVAFPAWTRVGPRTAGSVSGMGQMMLMMFGSFLALPILGLPAILIAAIVWFALQWTIGTVPLIVPAVVLFGAVLAECALAIEGLGNLLDRTDISAVEPG